MIVNNQFKMLINKPKPWLAFLVGLATWFLAFIRLSLKGHLSSPDYNLFIAINIGLANAAIFFGFKSQRKIPGSLGLGLGILYIMQVLFQFISTNIGR